MGELTTQLSSQTSRLMRDEMRLAQKEFVESAKHAGIGAGLFSAAGLVAVFGLGNVIAAVIAALSLALPVWAAALIVAVALFAAAGRGSGQQEATRPSLTHPRDDRCQRQTRHPRTQGRPP